MWFVECEIRGVMWQKHLNKPSLWGSSTPCCIVSIRGEYGGHHSWIILMLFIINMKNITNFLSFNFFYRRMTHLEFLIFLATIKVGNKTKEYHLPRIENIFETAVASKRSVLIHLRFLTNQMLRENHRCTYFYTTKTQVRRICAFRLPTVE